MRRKSTPHFHSDSSKKATISATAQSDLLEQLLVDSYFVSSKLASQLSAIMAPSFDQLSDHDLQEEDEEIDFSDLQERYDVRLEEGLDTFVVCQQRLAHTVHY